MTGPETVRYEADGLAMAGAPFLPADVARPTAGAPDPNGSKDEALR